MLKYLYSVLLCVCLFVNADAAKVEDKKLSIEFRLKESLAKAALFDVDKWEPVRKAYYQAKKQSVRDEIAIAHYKSLYSKHLKYFSTIKSVEKGVEITGIVSAIALSFGAGAIARALNLPLDVQALAQPIGTQIGMGGLFSWLGIQLSPNAISEHSPFSLAKDTVKYARYATGKNYDDCFLRADEVFAKAYFKLLDNHQVLFEKTREIAYQMRSDVEEHLIHYRTYIETAAALPLGEYPFHLNEEIFDKAFSYYSPGVAESMDLLVSSFVYWSHTGHLTRQNKHPFYFEGIPGSGKTYAAKQLSSTLGVPLIEANLDGASYDEIVGKKFEAHSPSFRGRLLEALSSAKNINDKPFGMNVLFFIDEFDRLLNADDYQSRQVAIFMLKALDRMNFKFYSPYLGVDVAFPSLVVLSGNYAINDAALLSRFEIIKFDGYDVDAKQKIFEDTILPQALESFNLTAENLNNDDHEKFQSLIESQPDNRGLRYIEKGINKVLIKKVGIQYLLQKNTGSEE